MAARRYAALIGLLAFFTGGLGFFYSNLFGWFDFNSAQAILYVLLGLLGLLASSNAGYASRYAQVSGAVFLVLAVFGVFTGSLLGLMPLNLFEHVLHFVGGATGLYIGYVLSELEEANSGRSTA